MKRVVIVGVLVLLLVIPMLLMGVLLTISGESSPSDKALDEIPAELLGVYQAAALTCEGLDWAVLAAIHKIESGFGTGPVTSSKGAQGPMQFLSSTFAAYGVDGDGDGRAEIDDVVDAIFSAANLMCANGAGDPARLASAIWNYNHSQAYVNEVLALAASYATYSVPPGVALASMTELLKNPRIVLTSQARADLEAGVVDQRLVSLLAWITQRHTITVTVFKTGHSKFVKGAISISNHYFGRAADIAYVDGLAVSSSNGSAYEVVLEVASVAGQVRPTELGHPFGAIGVPGGFTDVDHRDHLHVGFDS